MVEQIRRRPEGGRIDRGRPLRFKFDGRPYEGCAGDTLASALMANGVDILARSFKYHRPRGVLCAGAEEPNAIVQIHEGARTEPNVRATMVEVFDGLSARSVHAWPNVRVDFLSLFDRLSSLLPAGFYYKTFKWPAAFWPLYESVIRHAAGLGTVPREGDPDRYDKVCAHCDVLVVGAGPSGLAAALAAGRAGARVLLADEGFEAGGSLLGRTLEIEGAAAAEWVETMIRELSAMPEVRVLTRTTAFGYYDHNYLAMVERVTDQLALVAPTHVPRQRLWKVRAKRVILATGAIERPLVFGNNDRPGIMLADAALTYVNRFAVVPGKRAVIATNNDSAYDTAIALQDAGIEVAAIVDARDDPGGTLSAAAGSRGIEILGCHAVVSAAGTKRVSSVSVAPIGAGPGPRRKIDCDLVCMSGGWSPAVHLFSQSGGTLRYDEGSASFVPDRLRQNEVSVGAANGTFALNTALEESLAAGAEAARATGFDSAEIAVPRVSDAEAAPMVPLWKPPAESDAKSFVDIHADVTLSDIELAVAEGYVAIEHFKRYTTAGMGPDQGKTGNVNTLANLADARGLAIADVGTTTFRPPYTPVTYGVLAGRDTGPLADPIRRTPIHGWHQRAGAVFEDVGQWKRQFYYPHGDEDKHAAVQRECRAARESVGLLDASTLGKIDIKGAGARELLNRVYTNAWNKLAIGRCRYGVMLHEDGMVFDDGVTARLEEDHYLMTTTTGNAAPVLNWLEDWLQCEWPDLPVYLNSVTSQWATITISGPNARRLLNELADGFDLGGEAFPHMSVREGRVADLPARVYRVSYTGDLSFEINVPANSGMALWQAMLVAGEKYGVTPIGTEALHILRAEKGYIAVGQDTDGSVTPVDLGMAWVVSKRKDFLGRRSLDRPDTARADRKQLVGLLTRKPDLVIPEGSQIVSEARPRPPMPMIGHVTSSYMSPNVGRSIALAMLKGGQSKRGETALVALEGEVIEVEVTDPVFFDPDGGRLHA
ncbi:MAG TPA: sarcosine oxidase subunit alpha family protein [Alphaproteobacteria bacterium]|nr:sarcosine oxidase subunit alpha family protein [Alphaproteobacteria bacterium]